MQSAGCCIKLARPCWLRLSKTCSRPRPCSRSRFGACRDTLQAAAKWLLNVGWRKREFCCTLVIVTPPGAPGPVLAFMVKHPHAFSCPPVQQPANRAACQCGWAALGLEETALLIACCPEVLWHVLGWLWPSTWLSSVL